MSYAGHSLSEESYHFTEMRSLYSTTPADGAIFLNEVSLAVWKTTWTLFIVRPARQNEPQWYLYKCLMIKKFCKHNSESPNAFFSVKWTNLTGLWNAKLAWNSPNSIHLVCLYSLEHGIEIHGFRPTSPYLIIEVLATWANFFNTL